MGLLGRNGTFYTLLEQQADAAHRGAQAFRSMANEFCRAAEYAARIEQIEQEADDLTHQLTNKVDATFVTPLDKEDLRALSSGLDDITDLIEAASARIALYQLTQSRPDLPGLVDLLVRTTEVVKLAIGGLRNLREQKSLREDLVRIHQLENDGDHAFRRALAELFNAPNADPLMVIKWKEIYDRIEIAMDKCERVADIVESVMVKYA